MSFKIIMKDKLKTGRISLIQLLFVTYYPFCYKPCVEIVTDKKSGFVFVRKTKYKFEKVFSRVPILCLLATGFFCGVALTIVVIESKCFTEIVLNPKVWTWSVGLLSALCGTIGYKVWIADGMDVTIKMANEMITIEQKLQDGTVHMYIFNVEDLRNFVEKS